MTATLNEGLEVENLLGKTNASTDQTRENKTRKRVKLLLSLDHGIRIKTFVGN